MASVVPVFESGGYDEVASLALGVLLILVKRDWIEVKEGWKRLVSDVVNLVVEEGDHRH